MQACWMGACRMGTCRGRKQQHRPSTQLPAVLQLKDDLLIDMHAVISALHLLCGAETDKRQYS